MPLQCTMNMLQNHCFLGCIACTQCIDAVYCYRCHMYHGLWVCVSVCVLVGHMGELCKNSWTDRDAIWGADSCGSKELFVRWRSRLEACVGLGDMGTLQGPCGEVGITLMGDLQSLGNESEWLANLGYGGSHEACVLSRTFSISFARPTAVSALCSQNSVYCGSWAIFTCQCAVLHIQ